MKKVEPPVRVDGGVFFAKRRSHVLPPPAAFVDLPASMLVRDLASICCGPGRDAGRLAAGPKGSQALIGGGVPGAPPGEEPGAWPGPKELQVFASLIGIWNLDTGGRDPAAVSERTVSEISAWMSGASREEDAVASAIRTLAHTDFLEGPAHLKRRGAPGPPIVLAQPLNGNRLAPVRFAPGPAWVRELRGPGLQVAKLPRGVLSMHARNDRHRIALSVYLSIMLRVNRKYGYRYRVSMRTLLEGCGICVPRRNQSRFIASIYQALDSMTWLRWRGPAFSLYSSEEILGGQLTFWPGPAMMAAYGLEADAEAI